MFSRKKSPSKKNVAFNPSMNVDIHTSANGTAVHPYFSEKGPGVKTTNFINKRNYVKYRVTQLEQQNVGTASDTFKAGLYVGIGKDKNTRGIVKKQLRKGDKPNASTENLHFKEVFSGPEQDMVLEKNPRMLARQVASWKVARTLNMRVLSAEKYALDLTNTNIDKSSLLGISALLPETSMSLHSILSAERQKMDTSGLNAQQRQVHLGNAIFSGAIQKQLSDLQLIDALTGQTDRHNGNIYIDIANQKVHGIDNDQSFDVNPRWYNMYNAIRSFKLRTRKQNEIYTYDESYGLEYTQSQIDVYSAEKILKLTDDDLTNILTDKEGSKYGEFINDDEIKAAKLRLAAIKRRILALKKDGKLIRTWDGNSYNDALNPQLYGALGKIADNYDDPMSSKYQSYVARAVNMSAHDKNQFGG